MCFGPIRVRWADGHTASDSTFDDRLVLLAGCDLIEIDATRPHIASPNEYDFYFLARETVHVDGAQLYFWFPFRTDPMPMHVAVNDTARRDRYFPWQMTYLDQALRARNPDDTRSAGWNEELLRAALSAGPRGEIVDLLRGHLKHLASCAFALSEPGQVEVHALLPGSEEGDGMAKQQIVVATLQGRLHKGDMLHIHFRANAALADPMPGRPAGGQALLYYYNQQLDTIEFPGIGAPFRDAQVVPCALLHVAILFPQLAAVTPNRFARTLLMSDDELTSPTGRTFPDWRWFVICNAHQSGMENEDFDLAWNMPDLEETPAALLRGMSHLLAQADPYRALLAQLGDEEHTYVHQAVRALHSAPFTPREREILTRLAQSATNRTIAAELGYSRTKTVERYVSSIYAKLGLSGLSHLRQSTILAKAFLLQNIPDQYWT